MQLVYNVYSRDLRALDMIIEIHKPGIPEVNHYMVVVIQEHIQHWFRFISHCRIFSRTIFSLAQILFSVVEAIRK